MVFFALYTRSLEPSQTAAYHKQEGQRLALFYHQQIMSIIPVFKNHFKEKTYVNMTGNDLKTIKIMKTV